MWTLRQYRSLLPGYLSADLAQGGRRTPHDWHPPLKYAGNCGAYHRELPDFLAPYKHYETEVISGVLDEVVSADDMEDNCPCDSTVASWHHWLMINELRIDGYLKSEGSRLPGFTEELLKTGVSLLKYLRSSCQNWLEIILRFIYNSGGFLVSAWADGYATDFCMFVLL